MANKIKNIINFRKKILLHLLHWAIFSFIHVSRFRYLEFFKCNFYIFTCCTGLHVHCWHSIKSQISLELQIKWRFVNTFVFKFFISRMFFQIFPYWGRKNIFHTVLKEICLKTLILWSFIQIVYFYSICVNENLIVVCIKIYLD